MEVENLEVEGDDEQSESKMEIEENKNEDQIDIEKKDIGLKQLAKMASQDQKLECIELLKSYQAKLL